MSEIELDTSFRLGARGDDVYAALIAAHAGLSDDASARLNARLVLLLANQVGDAGTVIAAIRRACEGLGSMAPSGQCDPDPVAPQRRG